MSGTWELTQFEFWVVWETLGRDRMPFPLQFRSGAASQAEFDESCRTAANSMIDRMRHEEALFHALHALAHPEVRVEMFGYRRDGRDRMVRACATIEAGNGAVAAQIPGAEFREGANIMVSLRPAQTVVRQLLGVLPDVRPGAEPAVDIHRSEFDQPVDRGSMHRSAGERATRLIKRPFRTYAEVRVDHGAALDGSTDRGTQITVIDYVDDGRYLIREGERIEAMPMNTGRLCTEIDGMIARARDSARESAWRY